MISLENFLDVPYKLQLKTRNWRNSENVTKYFQIPYIEELVHKKWLNSLKEPSPRNVAFMIKSDNDYIGVTYFHSIDYKNKSADWGIYIYELNMRGKGIGTNVISKMINFSKNELKLNKLYLDVLETNKVAIKLYTHNGFRYLSKNGKFLRYYLEL